MGTASRNEREWDCSHERWPTPSPASWSTCARPTIARPPRGTGAARAPAPRARAGVDGRQPAARRPISPEPQHAPQALPRALAAATAWSGARGSARAPRRQRSWRAVEERPGFPRGVRALGGMGAISGPPMGWRDPEERHGFAGTLRRLGVGGPFRGPDGPGAIQRSSTASPGRSEGWGFWGPFRGPDGRRDPEERHGFAGRSEGWGVWGHSGPPCLSSGRGRERLDLVGQPEHAHDVAGAQHRVGRRIEHEPVGAPDRDPR